MITEDYVSFETAKLLKETGFNGLCTAYYDCFTTDNFHCGNEPTDFNSIDTKIRNIVAAPTHQMALKWLREKHNIHIEIRITNHSMSDMFNIIKYYWVMTNTETGKWCDESTVYTAKEFDNSEEAEEDAIRHTLEKLN